MHGGTSSCCSILGVEIHESVFGGGFHRGREPLWQHQSAIVRAARSSLVRALFLFTWAPMVIPTLFTSFFQRRSRPVCQRAHGPLASARDQSSERPWAARLFRATGQALRPFGALYSLVPRSLCLVPGARRHQGLWLWPPGAPVLLERGSALRLTHPRC